MRRRTIGCAITRENISGEEGREEVGGHTGYQKKYRLVGGRQDGIFSFHLGSGEYLTLERIERRQGESADGLREVLAG